ncbi:MAG: flagellin [Acidimicrobiales bacterium]
MTMLLINDNIAALGAENNLDATDTAMSNVVGQLSSGLQIQTAADNPAGYSIAQSLQAEINGYGAAESNAQTAVSVLQTAQGAINAQESILQQANTIATQAANSTTAGNATAAAADQQEFASLINQLDQIASSTTYAGVSLLSSSTAVLTFQVGPQASAADAVAVNLTATSSGALGVALTGTGAVAVNTVGSATAAMTAVQSAINTLASFAAALGSSQNQIQALSNNVTVAQQNLTSAHADLVDVNVASATSQFTSLQILEQSGISVLSQAQQLPQLALKLI